MNIHATAIISDTADLGTGVTIGAYCIVEDGVVLGDFVKLHAHSIVKSGTTIGAHTIVHSFAILGDAPQDVSYQGEKTYLEVGNNCSIREGVVLHRGSTKEDLLTKIGDGCYVMCNAHVGHDCKIGNSVIIGPNTAIGGHSHIGNNVNVSGLVAIHHFVRIGCNAMIGGGGVIIRDIVPFGITDKSGVLIGANIVGLKRSGIDKSDLKTVIKALKDIQKSDTSFSGVVNSLCHNPNTYIAQVHAFLSAPSKRGIQRGTNNG